MDQYASILLSFPPDISRADNASYDYAVKNHIDKLSHLLQEKRAALVTYGPQLLELLDPSVNSLSYLAVLHTLVLPNPVTSASHEVLLQKVVLFLLTFDGRQTRYAGTYLQDILTAVGTGHLLPPSVAVETLATAILRLDPTSSMLTNAHYQLVKLAYNTNNTESTLQVIDKSIVFYPGMAHREDPEDPVFLCDLSLSPPAYISYESGLNTASLKPSAIMEYDLFCGLIYCSFRDWAKAHAAFERIITFPTRENGISKIMVEAYKKWVLVSLLWKGKQLDNPPHVGATPARFYETLGKPYTTIAALFVTENAQALKNEAEANAPIWQEDNNTGLIQEVLAAYQMWQVLNLQQIYSKISISEIQQETKCAETGQNLEKERYVEMLIQNMIISGMLNGTIEEDGNGRRFLTFLPPTTSLSEHDYATELARTARRLKQLQPIFKATSERLGTSKDYIKHVVKEAKRDKSDASDPTTDFQTEVDDEDLMESVVQTG